jgi:hypothetical protein
MESIQETCEWSLDSEYIQIKNDREFDILDTLCKENGWWWQKIKSDNPNKREYRIANKSNLSITLFHVNYHYGKNETLLFKFAGSKSYHSHKDTARNEARDTVVKFLRSKDIDCKLTRLDLACDLEFDTEIDIADFFLIKLYKGMNTNSPFKYYVNEKDGSRTYYLKASVDPKTQSKLYLKHIKECLDGRYILRLEISYDELHDIGSDPHEIIKYIEKDIRTMKLFYFNDVDTNTNLKKQYELNIHKDSSPNVPAKLLREIKTGATNEIMLELPKHIKSHIMNVLTKDQPLGWWAKTWTKTCAKLGITQRDQRDSNKGECTKAEIRCNTTSFWQPAFINGVFPIQSPIFIILAPATVIWIMWLSSLLVQKIP